MSGPRAPCSWRRIGHLATRGGLVGLSVGDVGDGEPYATVKFQADAMPMLRDLGQKVKRNTDEIAKLTKLAAKATEASSKQRASGNAASGAVKLRVAELEKGQKQRDLDQDEKQRIAQDIASLASTVAELQAAKEITQRERDLEQSEKQQIVQEIASPSQSLPSPSPIPPSRCLTPPSRCRLELRICFFPDFRGFRESGV